MIVGLDRINELAQKKKQIGVTATEQQVTKGFA
ncbi:DUF896 domain-containing protein [Salinicoccus siamensis]